MSRRLAHTVLVLALTLFVALPALAKTAASPPLRAAALKSQLSKSSDPCAGVRASYADGSGFHGWTHVNLADGKVQISHTKRGQRPGQGLSLTGKVLVAECKALLRATLAGKLWTVRSKRKVGVPDETRPSLSVAIDGRGSINVTVWAGEARKSRGFARVQQVMLAIAKRISGGKVTY